MNCEPYKLSDFTKVRKLGKGGFGETYLARRNSDGIEVCLKVVSLNNRVSKEEIEREARMLSSLHSEHIIKYYGSFVGSRNFFIVMEYASEGSLADLIEVCRTFRILYIILGFMYLLY